MTAINDEQDDFAKIPHTGGTVTFDIKVEDGKKLAAFGYSHSAPTPAAMFAVWALVPQGVAVDTIEMAGINVP